MLNWLNIIDDVLFSPPHRFETILAFVVLRLGLISEYESEDLSKQKRPAKPKGPKSTQSS